MDDRAGRRDLETARVLAVAGRRPNIYYNHVLPLPVPSVSSGRGHRNWMCAGSARRATRVVVACPGTSAGRRGAGSTPSRRSARLAPMQMLLSVKKPKAQPSLHTPIRTGTILEIPASLGEQIKAGTAAIRPPPGPPGIARKVDREQIPRARAPQVFDPGRGEKRGRRARPGRAGGARGRARSPGTSSSSAYPPPRIPEAARLSRSPQAAQVARGRPGRRTPTARPG